MSDKGFGDMALDILKDMQGGGNSIISEEVLPEISDSDRAKLIGLSTGVEPTIVEPTIVEPTIVEHNIVEPTSTESNGLTLIGNSKFLEILEDTMRGLEQLKEMTSVGMIGVNMAGSNVDKKPKKKKKSLSKKSQIKHKKGSIEDFLKKVEGKC